MNIETQRALFEAVRIFAFLMILGNAFYLLRQGWIFLRKQRVLAELLWPLLLGAGSAAILFLWPPAFPGWWKLLLALALSTMAQIICFGARLRGVTANAETAAAK